MITVTITNNSITAVGHAEDGAAGRSPVCAWVSAVMQLLAGTYEKCRDASACKALRRTAEEMLEYIAREAPDSVQIIKDTEQRR